MTRSDLQNPWEKLADEESGRLPLPVERLYVPDDIRLDDRKEKLLWKPTGNWTSVGGPFLERFLNLAAGTPEQVLTFASHYGVFGLCRHGFPHEHSFRNVRLPDDALSLECRVQQTRDGLFYELVSAWRDLAQQAAAIMNVAGELQIGGEVEDRRPWREGDWKALRASPVQPRYKVIRFGESGPEIKQRRLLEYIDAWIQLAGVHPFPFKTASGFVVQHTGSLMGALALAMLAAATSSLLPVICSGCGRWFVPDRTPSPSKRRYCKGCGTKARWRDAQQERRRKTNNPTLARTVARNQKSSEIKSCQKI